MPEFTYIDLFAGIGGLRVGADASGGQCVFTSEHDRYARETYKANYLDGYEHEFYEGDIKLKPAADIPDHDLLLAGFPCQPFSLAGVSKKASLGREHGFKDLTQGTLFYTLADIIQQKRPKAFLLENVKNLKSHDHGNTYKLIMGTLVTDLGYKVSDKVIDARYFLPQHRERCFIVGFDRSLGKDWDYHIDGFRVDKYASKTRPPLGSILHSADDEVKPDGPFGKKGCYTDEFGRVDDKYVLSDRLWLYLRDRAAVQKAKGNGFGFSKVGTEDIANTLSSRYHKDGAEILVDRGDGVPPRRLTPRECSRLMGFDESGKSDFVIPVSDAQAYRQFGNSVAVPLVSAIISEIVPVMLTGKRGPDTVDYQRMLPDV